MRFKPARTPAMDISPGDTVRFLHTGEVGTVFKTRTTVTLDETPPPDWQMVMVRFPDSTTKMPHEAHFPPECFEQVEAVIPNKDAAIMELIDVLTDPSECYSFFDRLKERYCIDCGWKREGRRCYCTADC